MSILPRVTPILFCFLQLCCQPDAPAPLYAPKLEALLEGLKLKKLNRLEQGQFRQSILSGKGPSIPIYSETGDSLRLEEFKNRKINMQLDVFTDNTDSAIVAAVYRPATGEEVDAFMAEATARHAANEQQIENWNGKVAPDFSVVTLDSQSFDLASLRGKTVVLNFWFIRCHACVQEMPELNRLVEEFGNRDVVFLAATFDKAGQTKAFLEKTRFDYQIIADAKYLFDRFRIGPCPVQIVIDPSGRITYTDLGYEAEGQHSYKELRHAILQTVKKGLKP